MYLIKALGCTITFEGGLQYKYDVILELNGVEEYDDYESAKEARMQFLEEWYNGEDFDDLIIEEI